jgi:hypothetical protein
MATIRIGKPDTDPGAPSHVPGVPQGNATGNYEKMPGHNSDGTATAERSTGVNPKGAGPIDPRMPNLSPP